MADPNKTWTVVGTSVQRGEKTLRFANGTAAEREKVLEKAGCTEIRLHDLPRPMTKVDAAAWLSARGEDTPIVRLAAEVKRDARPSQRAVVETGEERPIAHEELGLARSGTSRNYWETQGLTSRQEMSRNAAWAAGIACPRGTYPELEAWLVSDGVVVNEDGTLTERRAA